jgi:hypothetical protein
VINLHQHSPGKSAEIISAIVLDVAGVTGDAWAIVESCSCDSFPSLQSEDLTLSSCVLAKLVCLPKPVSTRGVSERLYTCTPQRASGLVDGHYRECTDREHAGRTASSIQATVYSSARPAIEVSFS